jgi:hypothetical protein
MLMSPNRFVAQSAECVGHEGACITVLALPLGVGWLASTKLGQAALALFGFGAEVQGMADGIPKAGGSVSLGAKGVKESLQAINLPARIEKSGMRTAEAGRFFGWGPNGRIEKAPFAFSRESLEAAGWTKDTISNVAQGYREIARITPNNSSALPRAEQMESLLKLWR